MVFQNRLIQVWNNLFSNQSVDFFSFERCPMLIGIMRRSAGEEGWACTSEYEFQLLMKNDTLTRTHNKTTRKTLLCELSNYKKKCDDNEQALVSF